MTNFKKKARFFGFLLISMMIFGGCVGIGNVGINHISGEGEEVAEVLQLSGEVRKIDISGVSATLNITANSSSSVSYNMAENLRDLLDIEVIEDGILRISSNRRGTTIGRNHEIIFDVGTNVLEELALSHEVQVNGEGIFTAETFTIDSSGATRINLDLNTQNTIIDASGVADVTLVGETARLEIDISGAGSIDARGLIADDADVSLSGAGDVSVYANNHLDVTVSGVGSVEYFGNPEVTQSVSGLGSIRRGD